MTLIARSEGLEQLFDADGHRKYLTGGEVNRFLRAGGKADDQTQALCLLLAYTGCRISEALALTPTRLDPETSRVIFRTLKRRARVFRAVPVPAELMTLLRQLAVDRPADAPLWTWTRQTAWRRIKAVMRAAGITGAQATPKGLRHGFGIANAEENVPPSLTQRWMGHARLETTAIYQHAVGREERAFARRLWRRHPVVG
ncbi:integrase [Caulobacter ginsengisoli]|uniref:Integrase n=1 Tax=Caulobacter ginsengisoli TaxID=400775 RepID=A0ABU0IPL7_9CAUL|nr:site-specific integrase [Caulobacter ginsengisoli]MDQ0462959.1 integrase [Caulobacter ginsengisoli]